MSRRERCSGQVQEFGRTDIQTEALIREVQARPGLWRHGHEDFTNAKVTSKLWAEVGDTVNLPAELAKKEWKNLKDTYRKILYFRKKDKRFLDKMQFTREVSLTKVLADDDAENYSSHVKEEFNEISNDLDHGCESTTQNSPREKSTFWTTRNTTTKYTDQDDVKNALTELLGDEDNELTSENPAECTQGVRKTRRLRRRQDGSSLNDEGKRTLKRKTAYLEGGDTEAVQNNQPKEKKTEEDDDYYFLMSLHPFIKPLQPFEKLELRGRLLSQVMESYKNYKQQNYENPLSQNIPGTSYQFVHAEPTCLIEYAKAGDGSTE